MGEMFLNKISVLGRVVLPNASTCYKAVVCIPHYGLMFIPFYWWWCWCL